MHNILTTDLVNYYKKISNLGQNIVGNSMLRCHTTKIVSSFNFYNRGKKIEGNLTILFISFVKNNLLLLKVSMDLYFKEEPRLYGDLLTVKVSVDDQHETPVYIDLPHMNCYRDLIFKDTQYDFDMYFIRQIINREIHSNFIEEIHRFEEKIKQAVEQNAKKWIKLGSCWTNWDQNQGQKCSLSEIIDSMMSPIFKRRCNYDFDEDDDDNLSNPWLKLRIPLNDGKLDIKIHDDHNNVYLSRDPSLLIQELQAYNRYEMRGRIRCKHLWFQRSGRWGITMVYEEINLRPNNNRWQDLVFNTIFSITEDVEEGGTKAASEHSISTLQPWRIVNDVDKKCTICLELFKKNNEVVALPCAHQYHLDCVTKWLKISNLCPLCKVSI